LRPTQKNLTSLPSRINAARSRASRTIAVLNGPHSPRSAVQRRVNVPYRCRCRAEVAADRFPGLSAPFQALDFSDFLLVCRDDFPDDIAYVIAAVMCETPKLLESQYRHIPAKDNPVTYPLKPQKIAATQFLLRQAQSNTIASGDICRTARRARPGRIVIHLSRCLG
jgi:hypothetical protein